VCESGKSECVRVCVCEGSKTECVRLSGKRESACENERRMQKQFVA